MKRLSKTPLDFVGKFEFLKQFNKVRKSKIPKCELESPKPDQEVKNGIGKFKTEYFNSKFRLGFLICIFGYARLLFKNVRLYV